MRVEDELRGASRWASWGTLPAWCGQSSRGLPGLRQDPEHRERLEDPRVWEKKYAEGAGSRRRSRDLGEEAGGVAAHDPRLGGPSTCSKAVIWRRTPKGRMLSLTRVDALK